MRHRMQGETSGDGAGAGIKPGAGVAAGAGAGSGAVSYTHLDAADERPSVDLGGRRIIKKKNSS